MELNVSRPGRSLVLYHSQNGHTKSMADLVAEGAASVPDAQVRQKNVAEAAAGDLVWCDGIPDYVAPGQTLHYGAVCAGQPQTEAEREACRRLGRRLAEWVQTLICQRPEHDPRRATYTRLL